MLAERLSLGERVLLGVGLVRVVVAELSVLLQNVVRVVLAAELTAVVVAVVRGDFLHFQPSCALRAYDAVGVDAWLHALTRVVVVVDQLLFSLRPRGEEERLRRLQLALYFLVVLVLLGDAMTLGFMASDHLSHWDFSQALATNLCFFDHNLQIF